jgi:methylthioribose-1-phosphate isomerase
MLVDGTPMRTIWLDDTDSTVRIIDQTRLPHEFVIADLNSLDDAAHAISTMQVRGAPLIGAAAAWGVALAMRDDASDASLERACATLLETRPTAVNLRWALDEMAAVLNSISREQRRSAAYARAQAIADEDVDICSRLGDHGHRLIETLRGASASNERFNILTHCNAGWLATVDWGTALAPVYKAHDAGIPVHVWVDETRPRNQGASLTCWELAEHGVPHTLIVDNVGGHLMQHGMVDMVITGSDRTTAAGDVCNKIGTYLKALAAFDNDVPFHVALPGTTIDWAITDGIEDVPIEERSEGEVTQISGLSEAGRFEVVSIAPTGTSAANYAFDITPARLVTGLITERGVAEASVEGLAALYPEHAGSVEQT